MTDEPGADDGPHATLRRDPDLGPVVAEHGPVDLEPAPDPFRRLVVSVVNQQLSSASAAAIRDRLFERVEVTPDGVLDADVATLRESGLSAQKAGYVRNVAEAFRSGRIDPEALADLPEDAVIDRLTEVRGVGVWTAKMFCIFCLAREDVFPVEDLGIRRGMEHLFGGIDREAMVERAEPWRPYRSYASRYLWRLHDEGGPPAGRPTGPHAGRWPAGSAGPRARPERLWSGTACIPPDGTDGGRGRGRRGW